MKSAVFLILVTLLNISVIAKDKLSSANKTEWGKTSQKVKSDAKSGILELVGLGSFYYEGFDEYTVGEYLAVVDEYWDTWSNDPGGLEDGLITNEQSLSEPYSVKVDGSTDLILPMGNKISGTYTLNFNVYVTTGKAGYFNVSHYDTPDIDFAFHCGFKTDEMGNGIGILTADGNEIGFDYNQNEWVNVNLMVNLDIDVAVLSINHEIIHTWQWSHTWEGYPGMKQLGCLDIYANDFGSTQTPLMYFDDVLFMETETQQVELITGWNIMSFRVIPGIQNMMDILLPLIDGGQLKKVMDEEGKVIEDWGSFGGWKDQIGAIESTEGYKINVNSPVTIEVTGIPTPLPFYIPLNAGWNIISWPSPNEQDGMEVFQSLIDVEILKKVMNESGEVIEDWGSFGGWQNKIGNLKPGEGYKVNVTEECILIINENGLKSLTYTSELTTSTHFIPAYKGNGVDHMNINLVNLTESGFAEGDEIGIFDGKICVGSARITNLFHSTFNALASNRNSVSIPVSASDGTDGKNGYSDGNPITIRLFRNGTEYPLQLETLNNSKTTFERGRSLFGKVNADINSGILLYSKENNVVCYPNPFSEKLNFEFVSDRIAHAVLEIFNTTGQSISRLLDRQVNEGVMNRVVYIPTNIISGVYIYKLTIDGYTSVGRVIYRK